MPVTDLGLAAFGQGFLGGANQSREFGLQEDKLDLQRMLYERSLQSEALKAQREQRIAEQAQLSQGLKLIQEAQSPQDLELIAPQLPPMLAIYAANKAMQLGVSDAAVQGLYQKIQAADPMARSQVAMQWAGQTDPRTAAQGLKAVGPMLPPVNAEIEQLMAQKIGALAQAVQEGTMTPERGIAEMMRISGKPSEATAFTQNVAPNVYARNQGLNAQAQGFGGAQGGALGGITPLPGGLTPNDIEVLQKGQEALAGAQGGLQGQAAAYGDPTVAGPLAGFERQKALAGETPSILAQRAANTAEAHSQVPVNQARVPNLNASTDWMRAQPGLAGGRMDLQVLKAQLAELDKQGGFKSVLEREMDPKGYALRQQQRAALVEQIRQLESASLLPNNPLPMLDYSRPNFGQGGSANPLAPRQIR